MVANSVITDTERRLLAYLGQSLNAVDGGGAQCLDAGETERIYALADRHEVSAILGTVLDPDSLPPKMRNALQIKTARTVHKCITMQALSARLTAMLKKDGITAIVLKGYAVSRFYPVPEFRKTTDVDLFCCKREDAEKAASILLENGFRPTKERHANHHFVLVSDKGETVELHTTWADEFRDKGLNRYLKTIEEESGAHCFPIDCDNGKIYVYDTAYQAFYLAVHMLLHFVGGGFGLRNLCDWVVLWEHCTDESARNDFLNMTREGGIEKFAEAVTAVCVGYLGLSQAKSPYPCETFAEGQLTDELLRDILDAGEFGYSESERMVGMDGNSPWAYVKEFHHQMHINFPKAGRAIPLWPFLWVATLVRFLNNNRKLGRAPVSAIIKKAGNRGGLVKRLTDGR